MHKKPNKNDGQIVLELGNHSTLNKLWWSTSVKSILLLFNIFQKLEFLLGFDFGIIFSQYIFVRYCFIQKKVLKNIINQELKQKKVVLK